MTDEDWGKPSDCGDAAGRQQAPFRKKKIELALRYVAEGDACYLVSQQMREFTPPATTPQDAGDDGA